MRHLHPVHYNPPAPQSLTDAQTDEALTLGVRLLGLAKTVPAAAIPRLRDDIEYLEALIATERGGSVA